MRFEANAKNVALHPELARPRLIAEVLHRPIHRRWAPKTGPYEV